MKISTKGRYGLRVLLDVALHQTQGPVPLRDMARRQGLSKKYLWQVVTPLKTAGLLNASRGMHGGYVLARDPRRITVLDVVSVLEGNPFIADCVEKPDSCDNSVSCVAREAWAEIQAGVNHAMRKITLHRLLERQQERERSHLPHYQI